MVKSVKTESVMIKPIKTITKKIRLNIVCLALQGKKIRHF